MFISSELDHKDLESMGTVVLGYRLEGHKDLLFVGDQKIGQQFSIKLDMPCLAT